MIITVLLNFLSSVVGKFFVDGAIKYIALKALVYTLLVVTFPIVIKNLICWLLQQVQTIVSGISSGTIQSASIHLTGVAGYLGEHLLLSTSMTILLSAILIRFTLNFIPFIG